MGDNETVHWCCSSGKTQAPECQAEDLVRDRLGREPGLPHSWERLFNSSLDSSKLSLPRSRVVSWVLNGTQRALKAVKCLSLEVNPLLLHQIDGQTLILV